MAERLSDQLERIGAPSFQELDTPPDGTVQFAPDGTPIEVPEQPQPGGSAEQPSQDTGESTQGGEAGHDQDTAARYTGAERLGKSYRFRRLLQGTATKTVKAWESMKAKVHNTFDTPGKAVRQFAFNRAKNSYNRKVDRQQAARSARLYQRRQGAVDRAKERLGRRDASLQEHVGRMEARTRAVTEHEKQRRQEYINELIARKEKSLANKAVRAQLRGEGASRREVRSILAEIPAEHIGRLGKVAITAETSRRMIAEAEGSSKKTAKYQKRTEARVARTEGRIEELDEQVRVADEAAVRISTDYLPFARGRVETLGDKLDELEEGSPDRENLAAELQKAEADVVALEAQLAFWRKSSEHTRRKSGKADARLGSLYNRQEALGTEAKSVTEQEIALRDTHKIHHEQLDKELKTALNPSETGKDK